MKNFIKSTSVLSATEFTLIIVAIIRNKYLAVTIGPQGLGLFGLLQSFFLLLDVFAGIALAAPTVKYIAEYKESEDKTIVPKIFNFSFSATFVIASVITLCAFIFFNSIKNIFLTPDILFLHYAIFAASFISTSLTNIFTSLFQAYLLVKRVVYQKIIVSAFNLFTVVILIYFFDLTGFFLSILLSSLFGLYLFWREGAKLIEINFSLFSLRDNIIKKIVKFEFINILLGIVNFGSEFFRRLLIVNYLNLFSLGLFQAANGLTKYLGIVNSSASFSFTPTMSENLSNESRNEVLNKYLRMLLLVGILVSVFTMLFSTIIIRILYAKSFSDLSNVFYIFIIAQFLLIFQIVFQNVFVGMARLKIHLILTFLFHLSTVLVPFFFIQKYGLLAIGYGIVMGVLIHISISYFYLKKQIDLKFIPANIFLILFGILSLVLSFVANLHSSFPLKGVLLIAVGLILLLTLTKSERDRIFQLIHSLSKF